ncbi:hypothetical protein PtA15_8A224 [Puccinia triticina]|uniref:Uncharacterized protein n=1 Tax=Puccinia triticina TaxID=208348 RepID=A0ABY7CU61_9BASI|nr:uncharacterized protein PtA15_8A224 [Puccinia triticina]WAQ87320.1 hypothetical protein PtA15_8A224 [Puccinia triticina]
MPLTYWEKLINFYYKLIVGTSGAANPEIQNLATKLLTVTLKLSCSISLPVPKLEPGLHPRVLRAGMGGLLYQNPSVKEAGQDALQPKLNSLLDPYTSMMILAVGTEDYPISDSFFLAGFSSCKPKRFFGTKDDLFIKQFENQLSLVTSRFLLSPSLPLAAKPRFPQADHRCNDDDCDYQCQTTQTDEQLPLSKGLGSKDNPSPGGSPARTRKIRQRKLLVSLAGLALIVAIIIIATAVTLRKSRLGFAEELARKISFILDDGAWKKPSRAKVDMYFADPEMEVNGLAGGSLDQEQFIGIVCWPNKKAMCLIFDKHITPEPREHKVNGKRVSQELVDLMAKEHINAMRLGPGKHLHSPTLPTAVKGKTFAYFMSHLFQAHHKSHLSDFLEGAC